MIQRYGRSPVSGVFCATDEGDYVEYADHVAEMKRIKVALRKCVDKMQDDGYHSDEVFAARAAAPATGAEQVHTPKTIVPEPNQRRIETERVPKKGGE
jgi:hypothetical protein